MTKPPITAVVLLLALGTALAQAPPPDVSPGELCRAPEYRQLDYSIGRFRVVAETGERAGELKVAARGGVDLQQRRGGDALQQREARHLALLSQLDIVEDRTRGGDLGAAEGAERVEGRGIQEALQP